MVLLSVTHVYRQADDELITPEPLQLNDGPHNNHVAPFTSKKHGLLLIVSYSTTACVTGYGARI